MAMIYRRRAANARNVELENAVPGGHRKGARRLPKPRPAARTAAAADARRPANKGRRK